MDKQSSLDNSEKLNNHGAEDSHAQLGGLGRVALSSNDEANKNKKESDSINPEKRAREFLRRHGQILTVFARDSSINFIFSKTAESFSFDAISFEVTIPVGWFSDERFTEGELDFANRHELAHFIDMRKNPDAYLEKFDRIREDAEKLARDYVRKHPGKISLAKATSIIFKELHALYNVLDDIYVNKVVFSRSPNFNRGDGRASVESLYKKIGYEEADLTDQYPHRQMIFALLRDEMLGDTCGKSVVDEQVEDVLSKRRFGKTIREWVSEDLKPQSGELVDPAKRNTIIRGAIQPSFIELLELSLDKILEEDNKNRPGDGPQDSKGEPGEPGGSGGNKLEDNVDVNPFDSKKGPHLGDILDHGKDPEKTARDILNGLKEEKRIHSLPEKEQEEEKAKRWQKSFDYKNDISEEARKEDSRIQKAITSAREEMRQFWNGLIGKSIIYRLVILQKQKKGELNVDSAADSWDEIDEATKRGSLNGLEIYDRKGLERNVVDQPDTIDVTLLVDCSGSMLYEGKVEAARTTAALLMYSIKDFNEKLYYARKNGNTESKLQANTEVIVFGSSFDTVKQFDRKNNKTTNDVEIVKSISKIDSSRGGTDDAPPLADIESRLTADEKARLKNGKLKKIVFVITDGASQTPTETARIIRELADEGVIVIGFQIGKVSENDRMTFQEIWNEDNTHPNVQGIYIGEEVSILPKSLMVALSGLLRNIRI